MNTEYDRAETASRTDDVEHGHLGDHDRFAAGEHSDRQVIDAEVIDPDSGQDPKASGTVDHGTDGTFVAGSTTEAGDEPVAQQKVPATDPEDDLVPLFDEQSLEHLRGRWRDLQSGFVDDPRDAVSKADNLVAELIHELTSTYTERQKLIATRWPESVDTESLRRALRSYRAFFNQLLSPTA